MKKTYIILSLSIIISGFSFCVFAQPTPPPVLPDQHGKNGNVSQNAAPLGDGADVLILLGAAYVLTKGLAGRRKITAGT